MGVEWPRPPSLPLRGLRGAGAPLRKRAAMHPGWPPPGELAAPLRVAHRCASVEIHSGQFSRWGLLPRAPCQPGPHREDWPHRENWASTLSVLTRLCPQAAHRANRSAIRTIVFRGEGKPLPRGAARPEWSAPEFGHRLLTRARRSSVPVLSRAGRSFHAEPSAAPRRRERQSRGSNRVRSAYPRVSR